MSEIEDLLQKLSDNNYCEYVGSYIKFNIVKAKSENKSHYVQIYIDNSNDLKIYKWYKCLIYSFKPNCMVAHIHNLDYLKEIIRDLIKLNNLIIIK